MRSRAVRMLPGTLLVPAGLALAACAATITPEGAAKAVTDLVADQTGFTPDDVTCPEGVEAKVGETFDCSFTGPGGEYIAHMRIERVEGEKVLFDISTEVKR